MKTKILATVSIAFLLCVVSYAQPAQPAPGAGKKAVVGLTEDQKAKIKEIKITAYKETMPLKNQLGELKARQKTLVTAEKPDLNAINANIDEMAKVKSKLEKISMANRMQVRSLLTDEQKMWFDAHKKKGGPKEMKKHRKGERVRSDGPERRERG